LDTRKAVASDWNPGADGPVLTFTVDGSTLYVGGGFDHLGGAARNSVAAVDLRNGATTPWDAALQPTLRRFDQPWTFVEGVAVRGGVVYVAGQFTNAGGAERSNIAALDARTARATSFNARMNAGDDAYGYINALVLRGRTLFIGGLFASAGGQERSHLAAIDAETGDATAWNPRVTGGFSHRLDVETHGDSRPEGLINALATSGDIVCAGGAFSNIADWLPRNGVAALNLATGRALPWDAALDYPSVASMALLGNTLYVSGPFTHVGNQPRRYLGAVDATSGTATSWDPRPHWSDIGGGDSFLSGHEGAVLISGSFFGMGDSLRNYFAVVDAVTGAVEPFNAHANDAIESQLSLPGALYVGGRFYDMGGVARPSLAELDPLTGDALPWNPRVSGSFLSGGPSVFSIAKNDAAVFAGGTFLSAGGADRFDLAALDPTTGDALTWNPDPDDIVNAVALRGNTLWTGGRYAHIAGTGQSWLAGIDATSGALAGRQPRLDGEVNSMLLDGDDLFVGGMFHSVDGFPQSCVARIRLSDPWARSAPAMIPNAPAVQTEPELAVTSPVRGTGRVRLPVGGSERAEVAIYDVQGRRMWSAPGLSTGPTHTLDLTFSTSGWRPGLYLVRLENEGHRAIRKLVVLP
jgi:hypothetical protein